MAPRHIPMLAYNWITGVGAMLASVTLLTGAFFLSVSAVSGLPSPYVGIFIYLVLPAMTLVGIALVPLGMWLKARRLGKAGAEKEARWPVIDFNLKSVRNGALYFAAGTMAYMLVSAVGSYQAYQYTDSVSFCGKLCHTVMKPEYVTHQISPHAVVSCTTCHVGPGLGWYERSKVRGLSRVFEVLVSDYPRPIPTPISDLKPTEIECHRCHWPENFFGGRQRVYHNYLYDEKNTYWPVEMIVHVGGGNPGIGEVGGIHWSMFVGYRIEYIARDRQLQDIPWVRATNRQTGKVTVYQDRTHPLTAEEIAAATPQTMDCVDCHNSSVHIFHPPDYAIDVALFLGQIDPALPGIKKEAVAAIAASYPNDESAASGVAQRIDRFYQDRHAGLYAGKQAEIRKAIQAAQERYSQNIFPVMKADWRAYPDNVGHLYYKGCFRCHLGDHRSPSGETISHSCTTCHRIVAQGSGQRAETETSPAGLAFQHPVDIGGLWDQMACCTCHTGAGVGAQAAGPPAAPSPPAVPSPPAAPSPPVATPPAAPGQPPAPAAAALANAAQEYRKQCVDCHGPDGRPNPKMTAVIPQIPDFADPKWQAAHPDAQLQQVILNGKPPFMPAYRGKLGTLSAKEMAAYIRHFAAAAAKK